MPLDPFDQAILAAVFTDNQQTHAAIAAQVSLSPSAVRRRLAALRAAGVIAADVAVPAAEAFGLTFIVHVAFERENPPDLEAFRSGIANEPAVSQAYAISGDWDFVLIVHAETPAAYDRWGERVLMAHPSVRRYSTALVWSRPVFRMAVTPAT